MSEQPLDVAAKADDGDEGPIGIFPSWKAVYISVVVYVAVAIILLAWLTEALNHSVVS